MPSKSVYTPTRRLHIAVCFGLLCFVSWGLLASNPLGALKHSPLAFVRTISDILMHCAVYSVFSLACFSFALRSHDSRVRTVVLAGLMVHGISTELIQTFIPTRTCDPLDAMANMVGIAIGVAVTGFLFSKRPGRPAARWRGERQDVGRGNAKIAG